ncbi:hypothetical protein HY409_00530 [Candidatus Gottesmanbacteria bacterium]|nr:hypothetical protein [Candidatus Gottesmanbacteria bacterium]
MPDGTPREVLYNPLNKSELSRFGKIRAFIERTGLQEPRKAEKVMLPNGGEVRVITSVVDLDHGDMEANGIIVPIRPVSHDDSSPIVISVINAGMFEATSAEGYNTGVANTGNTEIKLASGLFAEEPENLTANVIIFVKPEGINTQSYAEGQTLIGRATAQVLGRIARDYKKSHNLPEDKEVYWDFTGYSEGSNQVLSVAAETHRQKLGRIRRVVSIGGAGFIQTGPSEQVNPFTFTGAALFEKLIAMVSPRAFGPYDTRVFVGEGRDPLFDEHIPSEPILRIRESLTKYPPDYKFLPIQQKGVGTERIDPAHDFHNVIVWSKRLIETMLGTAQEGASVPWRRVKEACAANKDTRYLAKIFSEEGGQLLVFADESDPFFAPKFVRRGIEALRKEYPKAPIRFVSSALGHAGPHYEQTAFNRLVHNILKEWKLTTR